MVASELTFDDLLARDVVALHAIPVTELLDAGLALCDASTTVAAAGLRGDSAGMPDSGAHDRTRLAPLVRLIHALQVEGILASADGSLAVGDRRERQLRLTDGAIDDVRAWLDALPAGSAGFDAAEQALADALARFDEERRGRGLRFTNLEGIAPPIPAYARAVDAARDLLLVAASTDGYLASDALDVVLFVDYELSSFALAAKLAADPSVSTRLDLEAAIDDRVGAEHLIENFATDEQKSLLRRTTALGAEVNELLRARIQGRPGLPGVVATLVGLEHLESVHDVVDAIIALDEV
jgi:hypothetical protein